MGTTATDHAQAGYSGSRARSLGHDEKKLQFYLGWKECRRLGIEYIPEPLDHSNLYIRRVTIRSGKPEHSYSLDEGLEHPTKKAVKYAYPIGMTDDDKCKFRAAARRLKNS